MSGSSTKNAGRKEGGTTSWEHRGLESLISLRTGDILLYRTNDLGATFNAIVQGSMYSHVSLVVRADSNLLESLYPDDYQKIKTSKTTDPNSRITTSLTPTHNDTIANNINQINNGASTSNTSAEINNCCICSSDNTNTTNDDNNKGGSKMVFNLLETMYPEDYDDQKNIDSCKNADTSTKPTAAALSITTSWVIPQKNSSTTSVATAATNTNTELAIFEVVPNRGVSIFPLIPRLARTIKTIQHVSVRRHTHNNNDDDGEKDGITDNALQDFLQFMTDTIGNQLDMLSFNMFRALILNRYKIRLSATSSSDNFFCSELVAQGLQKLGIIRNDILEANTLIPSTFAESRNNWRMSKTTRMMKESIEDLRRQSIITSIEEEPSSTLFFSTRQNLSNSQRKFLLSSSDEKDDSSQIFKNHDPTITSTMPSSNNNNNNNNNTKKNKTNNANNHFVFGDDKICCTGHGFRKKEILIEYGNPLWIALKNTKEEMRKQQQHIKEATRQQKNHQKYDFADTNLNNSNYFGRYTPYYDSTENKNSKESREDDNSNGNGIGYCDEHDEEWYYYHGAVCCCARDNDPSL